MGGEITLHPGDCRDTLARLIAEGVRVHSVVTDPPYGLTSVVKRFGKDGAAPARHGRDGLFQRQSAGFMGKAWDGTGIERDPAFWRLVHDILLPGGYCFAFGAARTGHWQAAAMEQAGFVLHPMHGWVYGSGFPKAHDAARAIDKALGVERNVIGSQKAPGFARANAEQGAQGRTVYDFPVYDHTPGTPEAAEWAGWAYGSQAQKPALEPIYLAQRPISAKTGARNLLAHGVGAVNIDACRVPTGPEGNPSISRRQGAVRHLSTRPKRESEAEGRMVSRQSPESFRTPRKGEELGRWPANLMHDGSAEVVALFPNTKGTSRRDPHSDEGSAARFFHGFPPDLDPVFYHPKARKEDRAGGRHPTVKPIGLLRYLIRHITPPGGTVLDPFAGSGTTGEAARREGFNAVLMEREPEYVAFLRRRFDLPEPSLEDDLADLLGPTPTLEDDLSDLIG